MVKHPYFLLPCPKQQGTLLLTPAPGTQETNLKTSLHDLKTAGATVVLTLMTEPEIRKNKLTELQTLCQELALTWLHLPIEDDGAPKAPFERAWRQHGRDIHQHLNNNETVAIHCKGGTGRTGTVAAQVLVERGVAPFDAMRSVKTLRPKAFSHTVQQEYIMALPSKR